MKKLLILDSNSIINRAFYGIRALNAPDGTPTNAVYGFLNILMKLINENKPDYILAAFDLKAPTFRHKLYTEYKANRTGMPEELAVQMPVMKDILSLMNIPILQLEGYEADDIIGTVSRVCKEQGMECFIATGDRDDLQLADNGTTVILASTKQGQSVTELFNETTVKEKYGVYPEAFVDLKALMGDKSDNIPGVSGIGEKTAAKIISQFPTIEAVYENIDKLDLSERLKNKLIEEKESAFLSKQLAQIDTHVPIELDFDSGAYNINSPKYSPELYSLLMRLGLKSTIKKLNLTPPESGAVTADTVDVFSGREILVVSDASELKKRISDMGKEISVYIEVSENNITAVGVSDGKSAVCSSELDSDILTEIITPVLSDKSIKKNTCAIKDVMVALGDRCEINGVEFDCAIAAYVENPSRSYDIDSLAAGYLGVYLSDDSHSQMSLFDMEKPSDTPARYALIISELKNKLSDIIEKNSQHELFYNVEMPLIKVLASMQLFGISLDKDELRRFGEMLAVKIQSLETAIHTAAGEEFNINSPKQLGEILFNKLGLPHGKKTKSGYSTKADILEKLSHDYAIVKDVLEYRTYQKLKSTYCDSLGALVNPKTERIHSVFHQTGTVTGRLSSSEPNMQNIPTRTELGRELRKMFVAKDGYMLVDADYSQIELRVLAHLSQDKAMIDAFRSGEDIHSVTASKILGIPINELSREQRTSAKAINFGIVYGMSEYTLSQDLNIPYYEAKRYMDEYFNKYSGVRDYMDTLKKNAHKTGCVYTMLNRVRYIPELNSQNAQLRGYGERAAMNTPVQGSAADIIKCAMVRVYNRLRDEGLKSRLILQVHDELIIEAPENEIDTVKKILKSEMENAVKLDVPLVVDMAVGKSWYDAK